MTMANDGSARPAVRTAPRVPARAARTVLFITFDTVGAQIGGSAIRVLEMARALSAAGHAPHVAALDIRPDAPAQPFPVYAFGAGRAKAILRPLVNASDVIVLPVHGLVRLPFLARVDRPLVFDLYDPSVFELLESGHDQPQARHTRDVLTEIDIVNHVLRRGDYFLCASERQRDLWIGALMVNGRVAPDAQMDPEFRGLVDVVPFGIGTPPAERPAGRPALTASVPAIAAADTVLVWGGGLWDWLDPFTVIRAVALLAHRRPVVQLVVFAGIHPTTGQIGTSTAERARALASELRVAGQHVHFINKYIPYADRGRYLQECDAGVSAHRRHLETRFSFRTRILDYFWAGLPVICTEGDVLADRVASEGLGLVVPPDDVEAFAGAILRLATDAALVAKCRARISETELGTWNRVVEPLVRYCDDPQRVRGARAGAGRSRRASAHVSAAWRVLTTKGVREAARRLHRHWFLR